MAFVNETIILLIPSKNTRSRTILRNRLIPTLNQAQAGSVSLHDGDGPIIRPETDYTVIACCRTHNHINGDEMSKHHAVRIKG
jgi:hypothetical protein